MSKSGFEFSATFLSVGTLSSSPPSSTISMFFSIKVDSKVDGDEMLEGAVEVMMGSVLDKEVESKRYEWKKMGQMYYIKPKKLRKKNLP